MRRTTIKLPDELDQRLRREAERRGITVSQLTREAIAAHLGGGPGRRVFRSAGAGNSGRSDISQRIDELLAELGFGGERLIIDTGALVALADEADEFHSRARDLLLGFPGPLIVPALVIGEAAFLIGKVHGPRAEGLLLVDLAGSDLTVDHVPLDEWVRVGELVARYANLPLGTVDASVVAAAERLGVTTIATTDRRHFSVVRPRHAPGFTLPLLN